MLQYTTFFDRKKATIANSKSSPKIGEKFLLWGLKGVALLLMIYFIGLKVQQGRLSFGQLWILIQEIYLSQHWCFWLIPLLLVVANWALEAKKWQILTSPIFQLNMVQASRAVITGLSLGFITPRSLGDYAGRILEAPGKGRVRLVGAVLLNRISQSFITFSFGFLGLCVIFSFSPGSVVFNQWGIIILVLLATFTVLLLLGKGRFWLVAIAERFMGKKLGKVLKIMGAYSQKEINLVLIYALLRYTVFSFQFMLILWWAGVKLPLPFLAAGVASVFLLKSVIPAFNFLSDLGVREFSALWVFSFFAVAENQLVTASLLVWCLNILLPTLLGGVNILRIRLNRFK